MNEQQIKLLIEAIQQKAAEVTLMSDTDYELGPNNDDSYRDGCNDGEIYFARHLLKIVNTNPGE